MVPVQGLGLGLAQGQRLGHAQGQGLGHAQGQGLGDVYTHIQDMLLDAPKLLTKKPRDIDERILYLAGVLERSIVTVDSHQSDQDGDSPGPGASLGPGASPSPSPRALQLAREVSVGAPRLLVEVTLTHNTTTTSSITSRQHTT